MSKKYKLVESDLTEHDLEDYEEEYEAEPITQAHSGLFVALICVMLIAIVLGTLATILYFKNQNAEETYVPADPVITISNQTDLTVSYRVEDNFCLLTCTALEAEGYNIYVYLKTDTKLVSRTGFTAVFDEPGTKNFEFVVQKDSQYLVKILKIVE